MTEQLHFHALEKEMATHSSVLAWRIPGMGEPGGLPSMESHSRTRLKRLSSISLAPGNSEGQALGLDHLLFDSEGRMGDSDVCVDFGLGASRRAIQSSLGLFFLFHPRFSQPKGPKISQ